MKLSITGLLQMCGISGVAYRDPFRPIDTKMLCAMTDIIRHRGPDGEGFYTGPGAGLGFRRLSIIDLETGGQPITNEDGSLFLVCNGEIYNFLELRNTLIQNGHHFQTKSDSETILHLYEEKDVDCLNHLRGMFAFALWDKKKERLFLARDRLGIKPLHYATGKDETIYFGSEQKAILAAGMIQRKINPQSLHDLFTFGFILTPHTLFHQVYHLPPGHYLLYKHGQVSVSRYWDLMFPENQDRLRLTEEGWAEALLEKLKEVVHLHMRSDVPVGAWLSGGIDSSAVVSLMTHITSSPVQTFSLTFENQPDYDEVSNQKTLDKFSGFQFPNEHVVLKNQHVDLFFKSLWHDEDPTTSGTRIARMALSKATSRRVKVVLTGEGSDELFGGYPWYRFDKVFRPFSVFPKSIRKLMLLGPVIPKYKPWSSSVFLAPPPVNLNRFAALIGTFGKENIMEHLFSDDVKELVLNPCHGYFNLTSFPEFDQWHRFEKIQYMETKTRLVDYIVRGLDRPSMAYSLEARVPFLDHELVELCTHIPPSLKMKYLKEKYILRKAMKDYLPSEILNRKKKGLAAPYGNWLKYHLPESVEEMLSESKLRDKGYFNVVFVRNLLKNHRSGKADYSRALMAILGVQAWDDIFIKEVKQMGSGQDV